MTPFWRHRAFLLTASASEDGRCALTSQSWSGQLCRPAGGGGGAEWWPASCGELVTPTGRWPVNRWRGGRQLAVTAADNGWPDGECASSPAGTVLARCQQLGGGYHRAAGERQAARRTDRCQPPLPLRCGRTLRRTSSRRWSAAPPPDLVDQDNDLAEQCRSDETEVGQLNSGRYSEPSYHMEWNCLSMSIPSGFCICNRVS